MTKELNPFTDIGDKKPTLEVKKRTYKREKAPKIIGSRTITPDLLEETYLSSASFTDLTDTPSSLTANNLYIANAGGSALEAIAGVSGTFTDNDGNTVTVDRGIITSLT